MLGFSISVFYVDAVLISCASVSIQDDYTSHIIITMSNFVETDRNSIVFLFFCSSVIPISEDIYLIHLCIPML